MYRLRDERQVLGYAKENEEGVFYKAYNDFHWSNERFNFNIVDRSIGLRDKKHRMIFEFDVVLYKLNDSVLMRKGLIKINKEDSEAAIVDLKQGFVTPINIENYSLFEEDKLEVISHDFGISDDLQIGF